MPAVNRAFNFVDESGKTYGRLHVNRYAGTRVAPNGSHAALFECICACGKTCAVVGSDLRRGHSTQCEDCRKADHARRMQERSAEAAQRLAAEKQARIEAAVERKRLRALQIETERAAHEANIAARTTLKKKTCIVCFTQFEYSHLEGSTEQRYCSDRCRNKTRRSVGPNRARAKQFNVPYEPINAYDIFARDNWTCQMCGFACDPRLRSSGWSKPEASCELDHIIPMEAGGPNLKWNVQTICADCHKQKSIWEKLDDTAVVCVETRETFVSFAEAARAYKVGRGAIADAVKASKQGAWRNLHWLKVTDAPRADDTIGWHNVRKSVMSIIENPMPDDPLPDSAHQ
jgi:5-methylcytosine-specific restriction endonuclease McrA